MTLTTKRRAALSFYMRNVGYADAVAYADAEQWASARGYFYVWEADWSLGMSHATYFCAEAYPDGQPETCESCVMYAIDASGLPGKDEIVASIGCVDDATDDYRRVIQAQLAHQARADAEIAEAKAAADRKRMVTAPVSLPWIEGAATAAELLTMLDTLPVAYCSAEMIKGIRLARDIIDYQTRNLRNN